MYRILPYTNLRQPRFKIKLFVFIWNWVKVCCKTILYPVFFARVTWAWYIQSNVVYASSIWTTESLAFLRISERYIFFSFKDSNSYLKSVHSSMSSQPKIMKKIWKKRKFFLKFLMTRVRWPRFKTRWTATGECSWRSPTIYINTKWVRSTVTLWLVKEALIYVTTANILA